VLSMYEGFFTGGARVLHSGVVAGLHDGGRQVHSVLSIHREMHRESLVQRMEDDRCYGLLTSAGVAITSLGRTLRPGRVARPFSEPELARATEHVRRADIVLSLKEQPLHLLNRVDLAGRPVVVCLHRSDPENQGSALHELRAAFADGRVMAAICCADSTRAAYLAAGIPADALHVIPNGVDLARFRPVPSGRRARLRRSLGVPAEADVVVFAARYDPMKNVPLLLRSARSYLQRHPRGHVMMCGSGMCVTNPGLRADIDSVFADAPSLLRRLHLLGTRHDMHRVYAAADVVALTSSIGEAAPLCLIEGMMCGAVPVATDIGDTAAIVAGHGILVRPDPDAISAAWAEALARRTDLMPAMMRSRPRFSQTRMIASYASLIDRVAGDANAASRSPLRIGVG
jgi:glycosyltransferase involved in cell wall biosynthesis